MLSIFSSDPYEYGDYALGLGRVDFDDPRVQMAVYGELPHRMGVRGPDILTYDLVGFDLRDSALDAFIQRAISEIGTVDNQSDLERLTGFIHDNISYDPNYRHLVRELRKERVYQIFTGDRQPLSEDLERFRGIQSDSKLGEILASDSAVCIQLAAAEMAILRLMGKNAELVGNKNHAYVLVDMADSEIPGQIIVDPTWDVIGARCDILNLLQSKGLETKSHLPEGETIMQFNPDWMRADFDYTHTS